MTAQDGPPPLPPQGGAAPPPPPAPPSRGPAQPALHHVTEQTRTYPCHQCGAELEFSPSAQQLACPSCGHQQIVEDAGRSVEEQDLRTALQALRQRGSGELQTMVSGGKEVVCQNCGGHTTFTGTLTSTRCPYCATPIQRDDVHDAPERLPVDGVLPFAVDRPTAEAALEKWINGRWFAPNEFKTYNRTGSFASVYAAYFTYDAEAETRYRGQRGDDYTVTVGSGDNRRTETRTRWSHRSGQVNDSFDDVAVYANEGLDRGHVQKLEPWPMERVKPFSAEYVAGHLCRTYDRDVEACFGDARGRMDAVIDGTIRRDIGGDKQQIDQKETRFSLLTFKHLLLPIWLLTVIYEERPFQVIINGMTGEVQGQRPYSKVKIAAAVAAAILVVAIFLVLRSVLA